MNARIAKETRALLPAFCATVAVTLATSLAWRGNAALQGDIILFTLCAVIMAAMCFGNEFQYRTMPLLLAQPVPRQKIWREKLLVLGAALLISFFVLLLCVWFLVDRESVAELAKPDGLTFTLAPLALVPLALFCTAPLSTLVSKSTLFGALFVFFWPFAIVLGIAALIAGGEWLFSIDETKLLADHPSLNTVVPVLETVGVLLYCALAYWMGYKYFLRLQAVDSQSRELELPRSFEHALARPLSRLLPGYTGPLASLLRKELRLQKPCWLIAGVVTLAALLEVTVWKLHRSEFVSGLLGLNLALCVLVVPLLATGLSISEERALGIAASQFTLPPSTRKQWSAKMLATLFTCVLLGVLLPLAMWAAGYWLFQLPIGPGLFQWHMASGWQTFYAATLMALGYLALISVGIFTSSNSASAVRAVLLTIGLFVAAGVVWGAMAGLEHELAREMYLRHAYTDASIYYARVFTPAVTLLILLATLHGLAYRNYRNLSPSPRRVMLQSAAVLFVVALAGLAVMLAYE